MSNCKLEQAVGRTRKLEEKLMKTIQSEGGEKKSMKKDNQGLRDPLRDMGYHQVSQ
jgi:hypothetical protein